MDSEDDGQVPKPTQALWRAAAGEAAPELVVAAQNSQRPGEPDCSYYLKFGRCRYGSKCMFNHPPKPSAGQWQRHAIAAGEKRGQQAAEYPRRPGEPDCSHYVKFGSCKFEMNCRFNHPSRTQVYFPAGACKCNHHEIEEVRLNSLGLPLRPGTGLCSYYMLKGICKFGSNCKFHHPNRSESKQEKLNADSEGSSHPDLFLPHAPPPLDLPTPSYLLQQSSKGKDDKSFSLTQPRRVYSCPEQSGYQQLADSHFEPAKQVRYTRDQLLQRRQTQQLVDISKDILELKQCIDMELCGEDYSWPNNNSNVHTLSYHRYDLADRRERHPRSTAQIPEVAKEKYWDNIDEEKESYGTSGKQEQFCKHDQLRCFEFDSKPQDHACFKVAEKETIDGTLMLTVEENSIFQSSYRESTGCKISNIHGHGYMSKRPTEMESMKAQLQEQARATDTTNQKNIELQDEVDKLNEKLASQEAESEWRLEEKMQQFREEESKKFQAFREELMVAFAGRTETPLVQAAAKSIEQTEATLTVEKGAVPNASETTSFQAAAKSINPSEATQRVEKSVASNASETPSAQTATECTIPGEETPIVEKTASKTLASKVTRSASQNNKNYISRVQLMNAATKWVWTRSQKET